MTERGDPSLRAGLGKGAGEGGVPVFVGGPCAWSPERDPRRIGTPGNGMMELFSPLPGPIA